MNAVHSHDSGKRMMAVVQALCALPPRQGVGEAAAADLITSILQEMKVLHQTSTYPVTAPRCNAPELFIGNEVYSKPTHIIGSSTVSGNIINNHTSFFCPAPADPIGPPHFSSIVVCNSFCKDHPSLLAHFEIPAVAVTPEIFKKALEAYSNGVSVSGHVTVTEESFCGKNIIVGDLLSHPHTLVVTHYDALVGKGALDNASGVAVVLHLIQEMRDAAGIVFALCGTEEYPKGSGYNALFNQFPSLASRLKKIIVVDSVGMGAPHILRSGSPDNNQLLYAGLPINPEIFEMITSKLRLIIGCNGLEGLLSVCHSDADVPSNLNPELLKQAFLCAYREVFNTLPAA